MSLMQILSEEIRVAMKSGDKLRLETLRMLRTQLQHREISKRGVGEMTSDDELVVLRGAVRRHNESIEQFEKGERVDLVEKERKELEIVKSFLPKEMDRNEIQGILMQIVQETNASSPKDLGKVMAAAMKAFKGKADGKLVQEIATSILGSAK